METPLRSPSNGRSLRRLLLGAAAVGLMASGPISSGCAAGFEEPSKLRGLRILGVTLDKPYANPGDSVRMDMTLTDTLEDEEGSEPVSITWLGGCFNPPGDQYFVCTGALLQQLAAAQGGSAPGSEELAIPGFQVDPLQGGTGSSFELQIPDDVVSRRPKPEQGPHYGIGFVFFAACAGTLRPIPPEGDGAAGSFPFGCFDQAGNRLGADRFVPGYTNVYVFADGRTNANPEILSLDLGPEKEKEEAEPLPEDGSAEVELCDVDAETRRSSACGKGEQALEACKRYRLDVQIPEDTAELDPDAQDLDGKDFREVVWVSYYADAGELKDATRLLSEAKSGYIDDHAATWTPPDTAGPVNLYAVVHDARGGTAIIQRQVQVK